MQRKSEDVTMTFLLAQGQCVAFEIIGDSKGYFGTSWRQGRHRFCFKFLQMVGKPGKFPVYKFVGLLPVGLFLTEKEHRLTSFTNQKS